MAATGYRVVHLTAYHYAAPVSLSHHVLHLLPRPCAWQQVKDARIEVDPPATRRIDREDVFGNPEVRLSFEAAHTELRVMSHLYLRVDERPWAARGDHGPPWDTVQAALRLEGDAPLEPRQFRFESPMVRVKHLLSGYAAPSFPPGRPLLAAVADLVSRIHADFSYDPAATQVGTSVLDVLAQRRGVCQDFAHLAIGCLRSLGLAARYVSGYLRTDPPAGQPRLVGADASHAWFAVWCPGHGWVEFDPTNDCEADQRHLLLAWGRDFGDVSPLRGVIQGSAGHSLSVQVTVTPDE